MTKERKKFVDLISGKVYDDKGEAVGYVHFDGLATDTKGNKIGNHDFLEGKMRYINGSEDDTEDLIDQCFVATAVYGNRNAPEVNALRGFRDYVLMKNPIGETIVQLYYSGIGKKAANLIKTRTPSLIPTIRKGLDYLANIGYKKMKR